MLEYVRSTLSRDTRAYASPGKIDLVSGGDDWQGIEHWPESTGEAQLCRAKTCASRRQEETGGQS